MDKEKLREADRDISAKMDTDNTKRLERGFNKTDKSSSGRANSILTVFQKR